MVHVVAPPVAGPHAPAFLCAAQGPASLPETTGRLRQATLRDLPQITEWIKRFNEEALTRDSEDPRALAERAVARGQIFLFQTSRPVSMAGWTGAAPNGRRISFVFTPRAERRRGYACACVAALSEAILSEGKSYCCLYADLANPTSNAIYARIGYEPLYDATQYSLAGEPPVGPA
jgi:predicted GNAT family acetyltransferase